MSGSLTTGAGKANFPPTRWSLVISAEGGTGSESFAALETICRAYWYPLYAYARRCGQSPHDAQDITQEFFRLLLEKHWLKDVDREKGRLRSFLITALKRFMAKDWRRVSAQRRGGGQLHFTLDTTYAENRLAADTTEPAGAEQVFDRQWALRLLEITMENLEDEFRAADKLAEFSVLKEFLTVSHSRIDYASAAQRLNQTEGAARVAVHRLRKRFREIYRQEVAQTLPAGEDLDSELRYLAHVVAQS